MAGYEWISTSMIRPTRILGTLSAVEQRGREQKCQRYNIPQVVRSTESYLVSFFGRVNYTLLDRYLFTATVRQDGSSRFHKNNRWGLCSVFCLGMEVERRSFPERR